jgi:MEMO1 family protein
VERIRLPAVAGSFYPSDAAELSVLLDNCFISSPLGPGEKRSSVSASIAGMVPHAGYVYSGPCAAHLYTRIPDTMERLIIIGVNHWGRGHRAALSPAQAWQTPLGQVEVDQEANAVLKKSVAFLKEDDFAHAQEHSIEVQLPFLQRVLRRFTFVPILLSDVSSEECSELGSAIADVCRLDSGLSNKTFILASTDLSHYLSPKKTNDFDQMALEPVLRLDPPALLRIVEQENISMCGVRPTAALLYAVKRLGLTHARLLKHCHSGDVTPMRKVVGYASVVFEH